MRARRHMGMRARAEAARSLEMMARGSRAFDAGLQTRSTVSIMLISMIA